MAIGNRQIGWSQESNLLWNISSQIQKLISVVSKSLAPKYKVYTALLSQKGNSSGSTLSSGDSVDAGITYTIGIPGGPPPVDWDFSNLGGPKYPENFPFVATVSGEPNNWGGVDLTFNSGTPRVEVLENTLGNIWFDIADVGNYRCISDGLFTSGKTTVISSPKGYIESPTDIYSWDIAWDSGINDNFAILSYYNNELANQVINYGGAAMIEIRVYN